MSKAKNNTIILQEPIEFGEEIVTELVMRKPKGKDLRKLDSDMGLGTLIDFAGKLCDRTPSFMDELDGGDIMAAVEMVEGFLSSGRKTGKKRKP